jgi:hypothetical protein
MNSAGAAKRRAELVVFAVNAFRVVGVAGALVFAVITAPATAYADCGELGQDPCTGPAPTADQVVGIMQQLTDPIVPAVSKGDIVTPGFSPDEAGTIDDHLHRMDGHTLPTNFVVTNIQPAPNNFAGATLETVGIPRQHSSPHPIVLVDQGGHWLITHDTAVAEVDVIWRTAHRYIYVPGFAK